MASHSIRQLKSMLAALMEDTGSNVHAISVKTGLGRNTVYRALENPERTTVGNVVAIVEAMGGSLSMIAVKAPGPARGK